jgi:predicted Zn-dependent protease
VPRGFKVINQPTQVMMVEGQNRAVLGFTSSEDKSAQAAAAKFLNQQGLRVIERGPARSNGLPAFLVVADAQKQNGQVVRITAYFIEHRGAVFHFVGYTAPQTFGTFRGVFLQTMQGFGETQDPRILNRQPVRLVLQSVSRAGSFRDLIPRSLPAPFTSADVAILNQAELSQQIDPGRILKIPAAR